MKYVLDKASMKQCDNLTITQFKVPAMVLMERAALSVCGEISKRFQSGNVLIACGNGNNGGDGYALGRMLEEKGFVVEYLQVDNLNKLTKETKAQLDILNAYGIKAGTELLKEEYTIVIDAVFGIGLSREITGNYKEIIEKLNNVKGYKIALDIPSGICADTGNILGCCFQADLTVTFGYLKKGLLLFPGTEYVGEVICTDIGIREAAFLGNYPDTFTFEKEDLSLIPKRRKDGNKGSFGKVSVFAGNRQVSGALLLAVISAYRSGCGYVKAFTEEANRPFLARKVPEVVIETYMDKPEGLLEDELNKMKEVYEFATEVIIGPGIGLDAIAEEMVWHVLTADNKPVIIDADAITIISRNVKMQEYLIQSANSRNFPIILTPHVGEFARLLSKDIKQVKENLLQEGLAYANKTGVILVCKEARTLVINGTSGQVYINCSGNEGMATAGSGDVLTGMIAGMLGTKMEYYKAVCMGVYIHGLCGDKAKEKSSSAYVMASDLIKELPCFLNDKRNATEKRKKG
ncbi:MAG: NAD(P)H-hydrate dehydratase [Lachnospiraceae bacterium]|nr:NAD(P)H-hydrate dehydratase [Lachnospiraceae bacterium]